MSAALQLHLRGIGVLGPGVSGWPAARGLLRDPATWQPVPTSLPVPAQLPPAERRRSGAIVKLSLAVAEEACAAAGADPATVATVFSASSGDAANCHALCEALATTERLVSPTRFTNSVHNAAAGYFHIAHADRAPSTSLAAFDASFSAGLLEAAVQADASGRPVLLVCGDVPYPEPLHTARPLAEAFGVALLLDPAPAAGALARLVLRPGPADAGISTPCIDAAWEPLRAGAPAARSLPLLEALARGLRCTLVFADLPRCALAVEVCDAV